MSEAECVRVCLLGAALLACVLSTMSRLLIRQLCSRRVSVDVIASVVCFVFCSLPSVWFLLPLLFPLNTATLPGHYCLLLSQAKLRSRYVCTTYCVYDRNHTTLRLSCTGDADLVVIGSGPGGYVAAIKAAQLGLKVRERGREK